jgi:hypothetical protein
MVLALVYTYLACSALLVLVAAYQTKVARKGWWIRSIALSVSDCILSLILARSAWASRGLAMIPFQIATMVPFWLGVLALLLSFMNLASTQKPKGKAVDSESTARV